MRAALKRDSPMNIGAAKLAIEKALFDVRHIVIEQALKNVRAIVRTKHGTVWCEITEDDEYFRIHIQRDDTDQCYRDCICVPREEVI